MKQKLNLSIFVALIVMIVLGLINTIDIMFSAPALSSVYQLPDLSGLASVKENLFIAVHDAKNSKERPRVSLFTLPDDFHELIWQPQSLSWPAPLGRSSDLESITPIPNTSLFLAAESGGDRKNGYRRIFKIKYDGNTVSIVEWINWPVNIKNVEAIAVARIKDKYVFLYAERSNNRASTMIKCATMTLNPWQWGQFQEVEFTSPLQGKNIRPISDMAVDSRNNLYIATAYDPDRNDGPFYSAVYRIGAIELDGKDNPRVNLYPKPTEIGRLDGFKVEGIAIEEKPNAEIKIFIGTDDENYGGVLRQLLLLKSTRSSKLFPSYR